MYRAAVKLNFEYIFLWSCFKDEVLWHTPKFSFFCQLSREKKISEPIFKFFSSKSCHAKLSGGKRIIEIGSETKELRPKNRWAWTKLKYLHIKWNNIVTPASISKISFSLESWQEKVNFGVCHKTSSLKLKIIFACKVESKFWFSTL